MGPQANFKEPTVWLSPNSRGQDSQNQTPGWAKMTLKGTKLSPHRNRGTTRMKKEDQRGQAEPVRPTEQSLWGWPSWAPRSSPWGQPTSSSRQMTSASSLATQSTLAPLSRPISLEIFIAKSISTLDKYDYLPTSKGTKSQAHFNSFSLFFTYL